MVGIYRDKDRIQRNHQAKGERWPRPLHICCGWARALSPVAFWPTPNYLSLAVGPPQPFSPFHRTKHPTATLSLGCCACFLPRNPKVVDRISLIVEPLCAQPQRQLHKGWWQLFGKADVGKGLKSGTGNWPGSPEPRQVLNIRSGSWLLGNKAMQSDAKQRAREALNLDLG